VWPPASQAGVTDNNHACLMAHADELFAVLVPHVGNIKGGVGFALLSRLVNIARHGDATRRTDDDTIRFAVTTFFAIAFLQSTVDKVVDRQGNLEYLTGHFASSPLRDLAQPMFWAITVLEAIPGVLCGLGALRLLVGCGPGLALWGLLFSLIALLCLFFGQRLAKDYGGAMVITSYYAVAVLA